MTNPNTSASSTTTPPPGSPAPSSSPGAVSAQASATGDSNVTMAGVFTVGGDFTVYSQQDEFTSLKLDEYEPPYFPCPKRIDDLVQAMRSHRMLVLAGASGVDKSDLARHIAWYFSDYLTHTAAPPNGGIKVLEWIRNPNTQRLLIRIQKTQDATIFLLPEVSSRDIRAEEISRLQQITNHYIVISTDSQPQDWHLPETARASYWCDLVPEELFDPLELARTLVQRIIKARDVLPQGLAENAAADRPLDGRLTALDITNRLKTLNKVLVFIYELRGKESIPDGYLDALVTDIAQRDTTTLDKVVSEWYRTMLDPREKLLALNASFFAGLPDDQFFAALEYLFERVWRQRDPDLTAYDYGDLADLNLFFNLTETRDQGRVVEARATNQRQLLFQTAWNTSRRQILAALPELASLVRDSANHAAVNPELFGSFPRQEQLRSTIAETLSDIGLIDVGAVQQTLIELAADEEILVQVVAAAAMARWRYFGEDQQLYDLLNRWQFETRFLDLFMQFLKVENVSATLARAYVRSTVALAVGYAALYDAPNKLSEDLRKLFVELSEDRNDRVRDRFRRYTLQIVVPRHLDQIRDELRQMTRSGDRKGTLDLIRPIALSLSNAYADTPMDVIRTLAVWSNESIKRTVGSLDIKKITLRETTLATIALTYGLIDYEESGGPLSADEAFERLKLILNDEQHPFVRRAAIIALSLQAERHFARVEQLLQRSLAEINEEEREQIANTFAQIYLDERGKLDGGDEYVVINDHRYSIWLPPKERPLTDIEQALLRWMKDDSNIVAQQIAMRAIVKFARAIDQQLDERIKAREEARKKEADQPTPVAPPPPAQPGWYLSTFVPWLVTMNVPEYRAIIRGLLPEAVKQNNLNSATMTFVVDGLSKIKDADIKAIAPRLKTAIARANQGCLIFFLVLLVGFIGFCFFLRLLTR